MDNQHYIPSGEAKEALEAFIETVYSRGIQFQISDIALEKTPTWFREKMQDLLDAVYAAGQANS